jgi:hypothetical protein
MQPSLPPGLVSLGQRLGQLGFERTRRALAGLALSFFVTLYFLIALNADRSLVPVLLGLGVCYGVAFVGVVAEWFWARWYASGLCWSGIMVAVGGLVIIGWTPALAIYGALHALVVLCLMGQKMAARYDLQESWRQRYQMDEFGVARLRKTITRASASLPSVIIWALGPKEGEGLALAAAAGTALVLAATGLRGVVRMRSWGVLALAGAAALVAATGDVSRFATLNVGDLGALPNFILFSGPTLAFAFLAAALLPFARPVARFLRSSR